jgi:peptidoglycan hydrolase CwlO-like protein
MDEVEKLNQEIINLQDTIAGLTAELADRDAIIAQLEEEIRLLYKSGNCNH